MGIASLEPSSYADFSGLESLKTAARNKEATALREAARQFESLFTRMLLKTMRETSFGEGLGDSEETRFYQDMSDQQLAVELSRGDGLGLAQQLVEQLTRTGVVGPAASDAASAAAADGASTTADAATRSSFIERIRPAAEAAARQLGVATETVVAHAALETGWGRHLPGDANGSSNNLFGIKALATWRGDAVSSMTTEYAGGTAGAQAQPFRSYASVEDSVRDYAQLLAGNDRYRSALHTGSDVAAFATALQRAGYATDPDYARKLVATAGSVREVMSHG
jgi:flagellar protein FlgJ